jgi:hypothetical protein
MEPFENIKDDIAIIKETLIRNTATLEIHVIRTDLAEKRIDALELFHRWAMGLMVSALIAIACKVVMIK